MFAFFRRPGGRDFCQEVGFGKGFPVIATNRMNVVDIRRFVA